MYWARSIKGAAQRGSSLWRVAVAKRPIGGFTLLEVLVALAVLATALGAVIKGGSESALNASYLRDKTFAHWVAQNRIIELQLTAEWPDPGEDEGDAEMVGQRWLWQSTVSTTPEETIRRIDVAVRHESQRHPIVTVTAYLSQPHSPPPP
ncbi:type II secretion system protein GspI [Ectothiorhodospiraceae bacterium BW-2]|nr:type II secretion system protein GspI [Ectothiorhodospiraceae bacterium BW-2]